MNIRDEISQYKPGQKITQMSRVDFQNTVRLWALDKINVEELCSSSLKRDRVLAKKVLMIIMMSADSITALMLDDDWTRIEFKAMGDGAANLSVLKEKWESVRRP